MTRRMVDTSTFGQKGISRVVLIMVGMRRRGERTCIRRAIFLRAVGPRARIKTRGHIFEGHDLDDERKINDIDIEGARQ